MRLHIPLLLAVLWAGAGTAAPAPQNSASDTPAYTPVDKYSPKRDPNADLEATLREAKRSHRNVLLEVGGEWCVWCHIMDKFFTDHKDLLALREKNFVTVKINMSPENDNKAFLSHYPKIPGYPHLFALAADGKLVKSQDTSELEEGESYNLKRFTDFLQKYAPAPAAAPRR